MVMKKEIPWDLIVSKLKNELTAEEEKHLNDWLPDHAELFDELAVLWDKIQLKSMHYNPDADYYWNELSRRMHGETTKSKQRFSPPLTQTTSAVVTMDILGSSLCDCCHNRFLLCRPMDGSA